MQLEVSFGVEDPGISTKLSTVELTVDFPKAPRSAWVHRAIDSRRLGLRRLYFQKWWVCRRHVYTYIYIYIYIHQDIILLCRRRSTAV